MLTIDIIIGNLCSPLAMITDAISSTRKTAKGVLIAQSLSQVIYCVGTIVLKGYSAAVQNGVSILRNIAAIKRVESKLVEWGLVIIAVALGLACNNRGLVGILPVVANVQYTLAVFRFKDNEWALKCSFLVCMLMFVVFNFAIYNILGAITNLVVAVTTLIVLIRDRKPAA